MLDKASLAVGKPTQKALEALEAADSTITLAHEFQGRQKAVKQREKAVFVQEIELRNQKGRAEQQTAAVALAQKEVQGLRRELEAERRRADKSDELAGIYRSGRDAALDEISSMKMPQKDRNFER